MQASKERFNHLVTAERRYKQKRLNALKGQKFVEYAKAQGVFVPSSLNEAKIQVCGIHTCTWFGYAQKLRRI